MNAHGEHIVIIYEWDGPPEEYIRGHVTLAEARKALDDSRGEGVGARYTELRHRWARWVPAPRGSDYQVVFSPLDAPARGAFAVTEVRPPKEADHAR